MSTLKPGDKAPAFSGPNENGETISLDQFKGKKLVLYFYPKDDTPGCTAEACSLKDGYTELKQKGIEVVGVSPDKVSKHKKFVEKYDLPFTLLADEEQETLKAYGVWGMKKFMGREYMGVHRKTFIIDEGGKIEHVIDKVNTKDHAGQIKEIMGIS
jgi:thioredoxin-dependent peroxiredoxin